MKVEYLGQLACGWRVQSLIDAGGRLRLSILGLELAIALAAVAQALPVPYLLLGLAVFPHSKPLGCIPKGSRRRRWPQYHMTQNQTARADYINVTWEENMHLNSVCSGSSTNI